MRRPSALVLCLLLPFAVFAAPKWHTLQAPHCLIVSQLSERETRAWATEFEQFTAAAQTKILIDEKLLRPLTVVLFAGPKSFRPYLPRDSAGKPRTVGGYCQTSQTWAAIALGAAMTDEHTRHIILHEATHWIAAASHTRFPTWLNEGTADVLATFKVEKGNYIIGETDPSHLGALARKEWLPVLQMLHTTGKSHAYTDPSRRDIFYAQSWLMTHRLFFENPAAGIETINRYLSALHRGAAQTEALEAASGKTLAQIEQEIERYSRGGRFTYEKLPLNPKLKVDAPFERAAPEAVELALARLAIASRQMELARQHIDRALELAPAQVAAFELSAELEFGAGNIAAAEAPARRALAADSRNATMHLALARAIRLHHKDRGTLDTVVREIADHCAAAIDQFPDLRPAYLEFASVAAALKTVTLNDAKLLVDGYRRFPDEPGLLVALAGVHLRVGNRDEGFALLNQVLAKPDLLDAQQRKYAEDIRATWVIDPLREEINALKTQRRYREALERCDALLRIPLRQDLRIPWEKRRKELLLKATIREADLAMGADDPATAIRLAEEYLRQPNLPPASIREVSARLERARNFHTITHPSETSTP